MKANIDARALAVAGFEESARKGRQCMDIAFAQHLTIEKACDSHGQGAVAPADIKQWYCHRVPVLVYAWMLANAVDAAIAACFLRLQLCPMIVFRLQSTLIELASRTIIMFTGCLTAVQAGRIPLLDAAVSQGSDWSARGFQFVSSDNKQRSLGLSTFVDHIYAFSNQADSAVASLENLETFLTSKWHLAFGSDSRQVMQCEHAPDTFRVRDG